MSYNEDVRDAKKKRNSTSKASSPATTAFVAFHPTKEEKEKLQSDASLDSSWAAEVLESCLAEGARLSFSYRPENRAVVAMIRDGTVEFNQSTTLSAFQASLEKAIIALAFFVRYHYPHFPDEVIRTDFSADFF